MAMPTASTARARSRSAPSRTWLSVFSRETNTPITPRWRSSASGIWKLWLALAFRFLSGDQHPDHATLAEFRKRHLEALAGLGFPFSLGRPTPRSRHAGGVPQAASGSSGWPWLSVFSRETNTPITPRWRSSASGIWKLWLARSEEHTSELQSLRHLVCRL